MVECCIHPPGGRRKDWWTEEEVVFDPETGEILDWELTESELANIAQAAMGLTEEKEIYDYP